MVQGGLEGCRGRVRRVQWGRKVSCIKMVSFGRYFDGMFERCFLFGNILQKTSKRLLLCFKDVFGDVPPRTSKRLLFSLTDVSRCTKLQNARCLEYLPIEFECF